MSKERSQPETIQGDQTVKEEPKPVLKLSDYIDTKTLKILLIIDELCSKLGEFHHHVSVRWKITGQTFSGNTKAIGTQILFHVSNANNQKTINDLLNLLYWLPGAGVPYRAIIDLLDNKSFTPEVVKLPALTRSTEVTPEVAVALFHVTELSSLLGVHMHLLMSLPDWKISTSISHMSGSPISKGEAIIVEIAKQVKPKTIGDFIDLIETYIDDGGTPYRELKTLVGEK